VTVTGPAHRRHEYGPDLSWPGPPPSWGEELSATLGYAGAIITGPVLPLVFYIAVRNASDFVRSHAAQALNVTLTVLLYAISGAIVGALLSFDSPYVALAVMLPATAIVWVIMVVQLTRAATAARRGEFRRIPSWICASLVS
jgi:uncharacterized membrane protein